MLIRLMRELGRLLLKVWAEQAVCASGRGLAQDGVGHGHALPPGRAQRGHWLISGDAGRVR